jgi:hypothetical protein
MVHLPSGGSINWDQIQPGSPFETLLNGQGFTRPVSAPTPAAAPVAPPVSAGAAASIAGAGNVYQNTLTGIGTQQSQLGQEYGFTPQGAPDASNPYSRATLLQQAYDRQAKGSRNAMAARGQLYAGSTQNAQNFLGQQNLQKRDALLRQFQRMMSNLELRKQQAKTGYLNTATQAAGNAADAGFAAPTIPVI